MGFEQKFVFFKTNKNSYTGPLCITYLEYWLTTKNMEFRLPFAPNL
jgi:hypothetical protein